MERVLEERLRERVCLGDTEAVQDLLTLGVDVNAREPVSGWTALHWACKEGYLDIAVLLLKNGADKNIRSEIGENPASVCSNQQILYLLSTNDDIERIMYDTSLRSAPSAYAPSDFCALLQILQKPEITYMTKADSSQHFKTIGIENPDCQYSGFRFYRGRITTKRVNISGSVMSVLQGARCQFASNPETTKVANTRLRRDKDIQRLQNFQEIEVVIDATNVYKSLQNSNGVANSLPTLPANGYQSISKKDQTICIDY